MDYAYEPVDLPPEGDPEARRPSWVPRQRIPRIAPELLTDEERALRRLPPRAAADDERRPPALPQPAPTPAPAPEPRSVTESKALAPAPPKVAPESPADADAELKAFIRSLDSGDAGAAGAEPRSSLPPAGAELVRVIDGDTFEAIVNIDGRPQRRIVRIYGIDAPELSIVAGQAAKQQLERLLRSGSITLRNPRADEYGRIVAGVSAGQVDDIAKHLLQSGLVARWLGAPPDWPSAKHFRIIWQNLPLEEQIKWRDIPYFRQRFGLAMRSGRRPTSDQIRELAERAEAFMREVVRPMRERGLLPPAPAAPAAPQTPATTAPTAPASIYNPGAGAILIERPFGRQEWTAWEKSLHPQELQWWRTAEAAERSFLGALRGLPRQEVRRILAADDPVPIFGNRSYRAFKADKERFLDATTRRWRRSRQPQPTPRRRRSDVAPVQAQVAAVWRREGMSENGIAGVLENIADESSFDPTLRVPDQPRFSGEAHYAHGLYQEGGTEWLRFARYLAQHYPDRDWRDAALQSEFTARNLKQNYPQVWAAMQRAATPEEAALAFLTGYLKPRADHLHRRAERIRRYGVRFRPPPT